MFNLKATFLRCCYHARPWLLIVTAQLPHCQAASGALAERYAVGQRLINAVVRYTVCPRLAIFGGLDAPHGSGLCRSSGRPLVGGSRG